MKVRNLATMVLCVCLTGGIASAQPTLRVVPSAPAPQGRAPAASGEQVLYLELSGGRLDEGVAPSAEPVPLPKIVGVPATPYPNRASALRPVPQNPAPALRPVPANSNPNPALQRQLANQLTAEIDALRAKLQMLNAQAMARSTPPRQLPFDSGKTAAGNAPRGVIRIAELQPAAAPRAPESPAVQQVGFAEPALHGDAPTASQREINRLITQCISDLEQEVRELGERVREMTPPAR
jgi:hypothetical protein